MLQTFTELPAEEEVATNEHLQQVDQYRERVSGILSMLGRDRMKVAFFGRYLIAMVKLIHFIYAVV